MAMHEGHNVVRCRGCLGIVGQCPCHGNKPVRWVEWCMNCHPGAQPLPLERDSRAGTLPPRADAG